MAPFWPVRILAIRSSASKTNQLIDDCTCCRWDGNGRIQLAEQVGDRVDLLGLQSISARRAANKTAANFCAIDTTKVNLVSAAQRRNNNVRTNKTCLTNNFFEKFVPHAATSTNGADGKGSQSFLCG
jgi:hypothetical protein